MSDTAFDSVIKGLSAFSPPPTVFFGGLGEPLYHPRIVEMVARSKELGARVEVITNGTLLTADLSRELLAAGIDMLWVSLDGATPESYADIRLGAALPQVIENIAHFRDALNAEVRGGCCGWIPKFNAQLGIEFVAMKRNIADLPAVLSLGRQLGAKRFIVTNLLPYTEEMSDEALYSGALAYNLYPHLSLPRINESAVTGDLLSQAMHRMNMTWAGSNPQSASDHCPFIENGAGAVGWDGSLSPCLPLLHSHVSFPLGRERFSRRWTIGNVTENSLADLWNTPEHIAFRERLQAFEFPPCVSCGGCDLAEKNEEDCEGNVFPTCGGCLWSQGVIQCP
jgi:MoaA/NifB/PqqE/SkfB family radical SAM enzyme